LSCHLVAGVLTSVQTLLITDSSETELYSPGYFFNSVPWNSAKVFLQLCHQTQRFCYMTLSAMVTGVHIFCCLRRVGRNGNFINGCSFSVFLGLHIWVFMKVRHIRGRLWNVKSKWVLP
jgi:hypothetical protein